MKETDHMSIGPWLIGLKVLGAKRLRWWSSESTWYYPTAWNCRSEARFNSTQQMKEDGSYAIVLYSWKNKLKWTKYNNEVNDVDP